ncbi:hypothetical protein RND81_04G153500 [Saponaria officinalis]|uniref:F-box domain-containing protein n=1 Tax=Saponaria officinalis TaxID=3572 RepID=A0AAW1LHW2_SAPOF
MSGNRVCSLIFLPEELIADILKRLPAKSLLRFMSVCKFWYSLIKNPNFISSHFNHHSTEGPKYLMYYADYDEYRVYADTDNFDRHLEFTYPGIQLIVGCCHGIICFGSFNDNSIVLWNSSSRKSLTIKRPHCNLSNDENSLFWFGFDVASNDYKVVWVGYTTNQAFETSPIGVYIYSLNERAWRRVNSSFELYDGEGYAIGYRGEYLNGVIHWVALTCYDDREMPELILTFNLADETFGTFHLPSEIIYVQQPFDENMGFEEFLRAPGLEDHVDLMVVKRGSKNCLMALHEDLTSSTLWVLEEEGTVRSWRKVIYLRKGFVKKIVNVRMNGGIVMQLETGNVVSWNRRRRRVIHVSSEQMDYVGAYMESLILL